MPGLYSKYIKLLHAAGDTTALIISTSSAYYLSNSVHSTPYQNFLLSNTILAILFWFVCSSLSRAYYFVRVTSIYQITLNVIKVILLYILLIEATLNIFDINQISRSYLLSFYIITTILVITWRLFIVSFLRLYRKRGFNYRKVIVIGCGNVALEISKFFKLHPEHGYRFLGFFDDNGSNNPEIIGSIDDVEEYVIRNEVDEIYCSPFEIGKDQLSRLTDFVDNNLVRMKILPEPGELSNKKLVIDFYDILPVLMLRSIPLDDAINKLVKRLFDIFFSFLIIVFILSWLLPVLAIIIKLDSKGPVFFKQERSGIDNKVFKCYKLRTMRVNSEANTHQATRGDSRITKVGAFLRKTSLDELPQFFNVFLGQMSVVGPRPHMLKHTQEYAAVVDKFMVRHFVKPGITGLSQVRGFRGDTSELYQMRGRVKLDIFYLENWSFILDLKIILYTVLNIFRGDDQAF